MMKHTLFIYIAAAALLAGCRHEVVQQDLAALTAKAYYEQLISGRYADFVDAHYQPDSIPASYREQLVANAKMYMAQQREAHRSIDSVAIVKAPTPDARADGKTQPPTPPSDSATVMLTLHYGDRTTEEVAVPMVRVDGVWYMR